MLVYPLAKAHNQVVKLIYGAILICLHLTAFLKEYKHRVTSPADFRRPNQNLSFLPCHTTMSTVFFVHIIFIYSVFALICTIKI